MALRATLWREGRGVATYLAALAAIVLLLMAMMHALLAFDRFLMSGIAERPMPQWPFVCFLGTYAAVIVALFLWFYRWFRWGFSAAGSQIYYCCGCVGVAAVIALISADPFSAFLRHVDLLVWFALCGVLIGFFAYLRCFAFARSRMALQTFCGTLAIIALLSPVPSAVALNAVKLTSAETAGVILPPEEGVIWSIRADELSQISPARVPCFGYAHRLYPAATFRSDQPSQSLRVVRPENQPERTRLISAVKWRDGQWRCDAITIYKAPSDTRKATLYLGLKGSASVQGEPLIEVHAK